MPQRGANFFTLQYSLKNDDSTNTVTAVTAVVLTTDTNVTNIPGTSYFGNIAPGEVKSQVSFPIIIYTQNNPSSIDFIVHIFSNGKFFWRDSFTVDVPVGVAVNETNLPIEYALKQNYPNPFNPTTTINYQIPELSFVTLKVYDVLGSEIITLVNEEKPVGSYEVEFNAAGLPSGVYFYQLNAGEFINTKKMILLK
ncbi:MAG: T9SS type A sorting domain-containing protein [Ignavibacteriaceae bacterium]